MVSYCETQNQLWMSQLADSHDNHCSCNWPFAHLLSSIFPPGHKDRKLTIEQILTRDYTELCHSGGRDAAAHGLASGDTEQPDTKDEEQEEENQEEDYPGEELEDLLAAAMAEGAR